MGRFIQTGTTATLTTCYQVSTHRYSYDQNECWQNKVVIDRPGTYTFTVPTGVTCIRTVAVGGGGKPCGAFTLSCRGWAGAGGGYVESVDTINPGCNITVVVGRQQQDTSISYTCSGGVAVTHTAGGAAGCVPGTASSTGAAANILMRSTGGQPGAMCNYQEAVGTCPSTCFCYYFTTCCGYCIVYQCNCISHVQEDYCTSYYPGGGSAGSFMFTNGGNGQCVYNKGITGVFTNNNTGGAIAGGGGGIGYVNKDWVATAFCNCVCVNYAEGHTIQRCAPTVAGGGGGTRWAPCNSTCERMLWNGLCENGIWRDGAGGWGGCDNQEGRPGTIYWVCHPCNSAGSSHWEMCCGVSPRFYPWHDIHSMKGSGSSGKAISTCGYCSYQGNKWIRGANFGGPPDDAGEGAGTGGAVYICCYTCDTDWPSYNCSGGSAGLGIDWCVVCMLGLSNKVGDAYNENVRRSIMPGFISYAGTLGGSGGIGVFGYASKAGFGGGGGHFKCHIYCVCWGTGFDCCNGNIANGVLAFPPCILDNIASNAGSGLAIIYWKDA